MEQALINVLATKEMAVFCFKTLQCKLNKQKTPVLDDIFKNIICPIFVTWLIEGQRRACIGTFYPQPLTKILGKYALISGLHDDRFGPITLEQVPKLTVCVSLLANFQVDRDPFDWQIGRHGVILHLTMNGRKYQATYLPQVALLCKWSKEETIRKLMKKSGCMIPYELAIDQIRITRYQSSRALLSYNEYLQMKDKVVHEVQKDMTDDKKNKQQK